LEEAEIKKAYASLREFLRPKEAARLDALFTALWNDAEIPAAVSFAKEWISQFRANRRFGIQTEKRFIVTAGLSAGKSTLINALVGKPVTKTSQEVCTANLCYIYNKPFEDNAVHLRASPFDLDAGYDELVGGIRTEVSHVASFFRGSAEPQKRLCLIDTPGANSAVNRDHGELTREALRAERYDKVIFVLNANKIGAGDEYRHLRWVAENVPKDKVIFVLNKLDDFNKSEDSVIDSLEGVRNDLLQLGYENPVICPLSAYFALLIKMKRSGDRLSEDEQDACDYYARKFRREEYDLSGRCAEADASGGEDEAALMSRKCGLSGLEKILFGGTDDEKGVH
jgi:GTP-binding protein EngB required for normal cell division